MFTVVLAAGVTAVAVAVQAGVVKHPMIDAHVYWLGGDAVGGTADLYRVRGENGGYFTYPPFAALLFAPFAALPTWCADLLWAAVVCACGVGVLRPAVPRDSVTRPRPARLPAIVLAAALLPLTTVLFNTVRFGQVGTVLTALVLADLVLLRRGHRWAGALTGTAAAVKLVPAFFAVWFLVLGRPRTAAVAAGAFAACALLGVLAAPGESYDFWTRAVWHTERVGPAASLRNQSVAGLLERAGVPATISVLAVATLAVAGLLAARTWARRTDVVTAGCLVGCVSVLVSPIAWTHHFTWLLLALVAAVAVPPGLLAVTGPGRTTPIALPVVALTVLLALTGALDPVLPRAVAANLLVGATLLLVLAAVAVAAVGAGRAAEIPAGRTRLPEEHRPGT